MAHLATFTTVFVVDSLGVFECVVPTCSCNWRSGIACDDRSQAVGVHDIHVRGARARTEAPARRARTGRLRASGQGGRR